MYSIPRTWQYAKSEPFVVLLVRANPFPKEGAASELPDGTVMLAHAHLRGV